MYKVTDLFVNVCVYRNVYMYTDFVYEYTQVYMHLYMDMDVYMYRSIFTSIPE